MATTYQLIATADTNAGAAASLSFTGIPATYTDLSLALSLRTTFGTNDAEFYLRVNSDSGSNYLYVFGRANTGLGVASGTLQQTRIRFLGPGANDTANTFSNTNIYFSNYAGSTYKTVNVNSMNANQSNNVRIELVGGEWQNTNPITSITITPEGANMAQYCTAYLYGIKNS